MSLFGVSVSSGRRWVHVLAISLRIVLGCILTLSGFLTSGASAQVITEFSAGITATQLSHITTGPDGNLWYTGRYRIGRITPAGVVTEFSPGTGCMQGRYPLPAFPLGITAGPDGNLWFTDYYCGRIGRITPQGVVTQFSAGGTGLWSITAGPDGNLWFTERFGNRIGRITPAGVVTEFSAGITAGGDPSGITAGPDGNLWFTEQYGNRIGRITPPAVLARVGMLVDAHAVSGTFSNLNGMLEPGESAQVAPTWSVVAGGPVTLSGTASNFGGPPGATYTLADSDAAYGSINTGAAANCWLATGNCYRMGVSNPATRPALHWDASFQETLSTGDVATILVHVGHSFSDVPDTDLMYSKIETLLHNEVTFGTGGGLYSPDNTTPRIQMAAFLARSAAGGDANVPVSGTISSAENPVINGAYDCTGGGTSLYNDVPPTDAFCKHVHAITKANIANGCDASIPKPNYCQFTDVTRAVMSIFVARVIVTPDGDALVPDANVGTGAFATRSYDCTNGPAPFTDVALGTFGCKHIGFIWTLGIVDGNGDGTFSPNANVSRGQMAKFLVNAFNLSINDP